MRTFVRSTLVLLLLGAVVAPLRAQDIKPLHNASRAGFWWGIGLGAASADVTCDGCPNVDPETFPMLDLRLGGTLSQNVTLGVQVTGGSKKGAFGDPTTVTHTVGDLNVSAYFYPKADGNFWLQGGITGVVWQGKDPSTKIHSVGGGLTLGAGYDFRFGNNASISPSIRGAFGGKAKIYDDNNNSADVNWQTKFLELGVAILWH